MNELVLASYSPQTIWRYAREWSKFTVFLESLPAPLRSCPSNCLSLYVSSLHKAGKKASTIKSSLSAISWFFKIRELHDPTKAFILGRLLIGIKRRQNLPPNRAAPITLPILIRILDSLEASHRSPYTKALFKALFLLAYYGAFRAGELVISTTSEHTLELDNVSLRLLPTGWAIKLSLTSFKHSSSSSQILVPSSTVPPCPVHALKRYLRLRPSGAGKLFILPSSKPVTRGQFSKELKLCVSRAGLNPSPFNTHSFRAGRTTDLAMAGASEAIIRETGRWKSDAFKAYIRFNVFELPKASLA